MEIGILLLRVVLALILFAHATQKLVGWFGGNGLHKQGEIFATLGLRPGRAMVLAAGV
jgi:putative oxidoreductase